MGFRSADAFVVNDDPGQLFLLERLVSKAGLHPRPFLTAEEALQAMDPASPPALVITDLSMPGMDGWQFCRCLHSAEYRAFNSVPIMVIFATFAWDETRRMARDLGAEAFFPYPLDSTVFLEWINAMMTVDSEPELALDWVRKGAAACVRKPFEPKYLLEICSRLRREQTLLLAQGFLDKQSSEVRQREEDHRRLFETMVQGVVYQDAEGTIRSANPAAGNILGYPLSQLLGKTSGDPCWKSIYEDGTPMPYEDHPSMGALRSGENVGPSIMGVYHPIHDSHRWLQITAIPLKDSWQETCSSVYVIYDDITGKKQSESKIRAQFAEMKKSLPVPWKQSGQGPEPEAQAEETTGREPDREKRGALMEELKRLLPLHNLAVIDRAGELNRLVPATPAIREFQREVKNRGNLQKNVFFYSGFRLLHSDFLFFGLFGPSSDTTVLQ